MRTVAILILSVAAISSAQERKAGEQPTADKKRLQSVTWDLKSQKLMWVVENGTVENGEFKAVSSDKYEISPDNAVMAYADEKRGFSAEEGANLQGLLGTLSRYCAESVIWWMQGEGVKLDPKSPNQKIEKKTPGKKTRERPRNDSVARRRVKGSTALVAEVRATR